MTQKIQNVFLIVGRQLFKQNNHVYNNAGTLEILKGAQTNKQTKRLSFIVTS